MGKVIPIPMMVCEHCKKTVARKKCKGYGRSGGGYKYHHRFCSTKCANDAQRTGYFDKHGYRCVRIDGVEHREHRMVMEKMIGRKLTKFETVHHKNGNRADNEPGNLELWSTRHCKGQRVEDKIEFCVSFLRDYGYEVSSFSDSEKVCGISGLI